VCRDFPRPPRDARMWRFSEVPRTSFQKLYEMAKAEGDPALATKCCNDIALFLHDAAKELSWDMRNKFETGLIHGDWHGGNLLFRKDRLAAIVDLEFAGDGCYLEDMSYAISNLCIRTTNVPERLNKRFNVLLDNYTGYRSLSFFEHVALPYAVGVKHVATVSYQITQLGGKIAGYTPLEWMKRLADQCAWLAERARLARYGK
jgi:Ser/Thr protein kinase RdoA (MazF antagonist)